MFASLRPFRIVPLLKVKSIEVDDAVKVAEVLIEAGLPVLEVMFRRFTDSKAIRAIATKYPDFWVGAGAIMNKDQLLRSIEARAKFTFAPGVNVDTIMEANKRRLMFAPGACTPTDIENILLRGSVDFQFFPAEQSGGVGKLEAIIEPFEHLPIDIFVKGGITLQNMNEYLKIPQVAAVSADWIATAENIEAKNWDKIRDLAIEAKKTALPDVIKRR